MRRGKILGLMAAMACVWTVATVRAQEAVQLQEVYDLLKANLAGATQSELNRAAVAGLIEQLSPRVRLLDGESTNGIVSTNGGPSVATATYHGNYGYIRLARLAADAGSEFRSAYEGLVSSNKLQGLVLDLRFAAGGDYGAAVGVADQFFAGVQNLVDWGEGMKQSTAKSNALTLPVTVLVNRRTSGAGEVLAGILRHGEVALLVGTNTAGQASVTKDFTLKSGQKLRVAIAPVKVMDDRELPFAGIKPDIEVAVNADEELAFMGDAYRATKVASGAGTAGDFSAASTNSRPRRRMNEAELVRMTREGQDPREPLMTPATPKAPEPSVLQVTDPVLARALDILKGLAVVHRFRGL